MPEMSIEAHPIDGQKCKQVIDDMIKTPTERKAYHIKRKLKRLMSSCTKRNKLNQARHTTPLTNRKESNTTQYIEPISYKYA